jgi:uncharacterized repeat protein (TIGR01451 family)
MPHRRTLGLTLLVVAGSTGLLALALRRVGAEPPPFRTAQLVTPGTPEPPLADAPEPAPPPTEVPLPPAGAAPPAAACPADPPTPVVAIRVRVPASAAAGEPLEYRIAVENTSRAPAHHVTVRNPLPVNARFVRATPQPESREPELVWRLGTLGPCACREVVLVLEPTGAGDVKNCARVQFEHGQCVSTRLARPRLALRLTGPTEAALGDTLTFRLTATNTGGGEVRGLLLTAFLPPGLEGTTGPPAARGEKQALRWADLGTLAPGQSQARELKAVAKAPGRLRLEAQVTGAGVLEEAAHEVTVGQPDLELMMAGPEDAPVKRAVTYRLTAHNPGTLAATNVEVTVPLLAGVELVEAGDGGQNLGGQVRWLLGTLSPGERRTLRLRLQAPAKGEATYQARATADRGLDAKATLTTRFTGSGGLTFLTDPDDNPVFVNTPTAYTIRVFNQGNDEAKDVRIVARVPEQMEVTGAEGPGGLKGQVEKQAVTFDPLPTLAPGAEAGYRVLVTPRRAGDVLFTVEMTAAQPRLERPVRKDTSTTIANPGPERAQH